jgi:asparagine synthase (glutamine-hydrolysing)
MLPKEVLWRSKEGFSEALGKVDLGDVLEEGANLHITDTLFSAKKRLFPKQTPQTKEEFWYRSLFEGIFDMAKMSDGIIHTKVYR